MLRTKMNVWCRAGLLSLLLLPQPLPAKAQGGDATSPYEIRWRRELAVLTLSGIAVFSTRYLSDDPGSARCPCDANDVNELDRHVAGRNSTSADRASDVAAGVVIAAPFVLDAIDVHRSGGDMSGFRSDAIVMFEALAVNQGLTQLVKATVRRPRPFLYGVPAGDPSLDEPDNYRSFFSGHTSAAFAAGMSYARTFALRHPDSRFRWMVYGAAILGGSTVAALRVEAGRHFPTDVLMGAVTGSAIGLAVPAFHGPRALKTVSVLPYGDGVMLVASYPSR